MQIGILEPFNFSNKAFEELRKIGEVELFEKRKKLNDFLKNKNILFIRLKYYICKDFLNFAESLNYICSPTTGLNHIDLEYTAKKDIKIISLKDEIEFLNDIRATPEHTFGLVLSLLRNYNKSFLNIRNRKWDRDKYWGHEIYTKKIGIIGFGRVGKIIAKYFSTFGAEVFFYDKKREIIYSGYGKRLNSIEELIEKTNIILLCVSYNKENHQFFEKNFIDLLNNKYFINTSRGELIDEEYLIKKIKENHFKGIALDVITNESKRKNNLNNFLKLTKNRNLILTPHISGATFESIHKTEEYIVEKLKIDLSKK